MGDDSIGKIAAAHLSPQGLVAVLAGRPEEGQLHRALQEEVGHRQALAEAPRMLCDEPAIGRDGGDGRLAEFRAGRGGRRGGPGRRRPRHSGWGWRRRPLRGAGRSAPRGPWPCHRILPPPGPRSRPGSAPPAAPPRAGSGRPRRPRTGRGAPRPGRRSPPGRRAGGPSPRDTSGRVPHPAGRASRGGSRRARERPPGSAGRRAPGTPRPSRRSSCRSRPSGPCRPARAGRAGGGPRTAWPGRPRQSA